ncbi:MAG: alginate export family protein [Vicinamibacterales bacterium]
MSSRPFLFVRTLACCACVATIFATVPVAAQTTVTATARDVLRIEAWSFFDPPPAGEATTDYAFAGHRLSVGVTAGGPRWTGEGEFQYIQLQFLPREAVAGAPLGNGGYYAEAARNTYAYQVFARRLNVRYTAGGWSLRVGRQLYESGLEADSGVASLEWLKRERLAGRLVSGAESTIVQRAFDGVRADVDHGRWRVTASAFLPTQGAYEESATATIEQLRVGTVAVTRRPDGVVSEPFELQLFAQIYRDQRDVRARPDNTSPARLAGDGRLRLEGPPPEVDVTLVTAGASAVGIVPTVAGEVEWLGWAAVQAGRWYGMPHRAWSLALEGGHRWTGVAGRPSVRAGLLYASGDEDGGDGRHGTFVPPLPDADRTFRAAAWAPMNVIDLFASVGVEPHSRLTLWASLHQTRLASGNDRWYTGTGATARKGAFFGYTARPASGTTSLGTALDTRAALRLTRWLSLDGSLAWMRGGDVVRATFLGDRLLVGTVQTAIAF